jgi:hypothetical protein
MADPLLDDIRRIVRDELDAAFERLSRPESYRDAAGQELHVGDRVEFVRGAAAAQRSVSLGKVTGFIVKGTTLAIVAMDDGRSNPQVFTNSIWKVP